MALVAFYNATGGNNWTNKTGWQIPGNVGDNPCGWFGLTCTPQGDRVVELILPRNHLLGALPKALGKLTALKRMDLNQLMPMIEGVRVEGGYLSDVLPVELGNLVNLEYLDLGGNHFSGIIPASIGNLLNLDFLDLSYTQINSEFGAFGELTGTIPDLSALPVTAKVHIRNQSFTFAGMEMNISRLVDYSPQNLVPLEYRKRYKLDEPEYDPDDYFQYFAVDVGGTESLNEYSLFMNGGLQHTQVGEKLFRNWQTGIYRIEVTNNGVPGLKLVSNELFEMVGPIPVKLISFSAEHYFKINHLIWKTTSETNNSGFEIERSADAKSFERIGFVDGNGDSKVANTYNFTDSNPFSTTYYRLKQIDYDGQFEYSRIIAVKRNFSGISIYPNPARNQIFVRDLEKGAQIIVRNAEGKTLLTQMVYPKQAVELNNFSNGFYFITIGNEVRKIVVER